MTEYFWPLGQEGGIAKKGKGKGDWTDKSNSPFSLSRSLLPLPPLPSNFTPGVVPQGTENGTTGIKTKGLTNWAEYQSRALLQPYCNKEGFNVLCTDGNGSKARIGIVANDQNVCSSCDSRIGFGTGGYNDDSNTCGNEAQHGGDNGDQHIKTMGYVLVRKELYYAELACQQHSNALRNC